MAETTGDDHQKRLSELQNEKAIADAEKALVESKKVPDQAKSGSTGQSTDLQNQKAIADAQKSLAESQKTPDQAKSSSAGQLTDLENQKALADSQTQSMVARLIGDVKAGPYSGNVDLKPNAGTEEALLLGARAVKEAAVKVAAAVKAFGGEPKVIHIFAAKEFPNFQRLLTYRFRKDLIKQAYLAADVTKPNLAAVE